MTLIIRPRRPDWARSMVAPILLLLMAISFGVGPAMLPGGSSAHRLLLSGIWLLPVVLALALGYVYLYFRNRRLIVTNDSLIAIGALGSRRRVSRSSIGQVAYQRVRFRGRRPTSLAWLLTQGRAPLLRLEMRQWTATDLDRLWEELNVHPTVLVTDGVASAGEVCNVNRRLVGWWEDHTTGIGIAVALVLIVAGVGIKVALE